MQIAVYNNQGQKTEELKVAPSLAKLKFNPDLVHQVYRSYLFNQRKPLAFTKDRGEVRGGGKKPWPQKGTGHARHSSIRSPIWRGGGVTFGPRLKEENLKRKINKKVKKKALAMVLTQKMKDKEVIIIEEWGLKEIKTREADKLLKTILPSVKDKKRIPSTLIVLGEEEKELKRAFRNLEYASVAFVDNLTIKELLNYKFLILRKDVFQKLIDSLSKI